MTNLVVLVGRIALPAHVPDVEGRSHVLRDIREGLRRLQEVDLVDRYLQS